MPRETIGLPKVFQNSKLSLEQDLRRFWGTRNEYKEGSTIAEKIESVENLSLLYILLTEHLAQIEKTVLDLGDKLLDKMENADVSKLPLYGKKIVLDKEANWIFIRDFDDKDWYDYDMDCNVNYVNSKKKSKDNQ